jgi:hypothetical protein
MIEIKNQFRKGLDLDTSPYAILKDAYLDALNITRDSVAANQDEIISNIVSNRLVTFSLPAGTNTTIGAFPFPLRNTVIEFLYNSNGYNSIIEYDNDTRTRTLIFQSLTDSATDILNFSSTGKITSVNVYPQDEGDLLYFLDTLGRPTGLNITNFKNDLYNPVTRDIIDAAKTPPPQTPTAVYGNDTTRRVNNLKNKFFKFAQVNVFDDNEESTFSPQSAMPIPIKILDDTYTNVITNNNVVNLSLNSGPKNVKSIRLLVTYVEKTNNWSDFATVEVINKATNSIADDTVFAYSFYNDSTYPTYDVLRAIQLFDYVPTYAESQEMANGNTIEYAGITEGYDRTLTANVVNTIGTVAAGNGGTIGTLNGILTTTSGALANHISIVFSGIPATGTVVLVTLRRISDGVTVTVGTYTTVSGDTSASVATAMAASMTGLAVATAISASGSTLLFTYSTVFYDTLTFTVTAPATGASVNSIATWLWSTERNIAIQYFDQKGRTNGVLYNARIVFPAYAENGSQAPLLPYINTKIYHVPPIWAYSYTFLFTKEPTIPLFWETVDVNTTESDNIYFDVTNITLNETKNPTTANVLNYSFADGDRLRLIRRMSDGTVYADTYDAPILGYVINPKINNVQTTANFIKIKNTAPFSTVTYTSKYFVIEIYRPGQQAASGTNETYYEFGEEYAILNPGTATRVHGGQVTNQSTDYVTPAEFNFYNGDSYFRSRTIPISETGVATFNVQDKNVVDFYISAVSSISGRPSLIDINAKTTVFPAVIRFSQAIQPNTNINGLNRFFPENFIEADASFGSINRMQVRDRQLEIFQEFKTGFSPLFSQIGKGPSGDDILLTTDILLNPVRYYLGAWGIGSLKASLAYFNYAIYFCDPNKGVVLRLSRDGLTPISILYKVNSWATQEIPLRTNDNIIGAYDQKANNYVFALEAVDGSSATTRSFSEPSNSFESRLSYSPEMMCTLGTLLITYKNGQSYTHDDSTYNNFYGTQYESSIKLMFNQAVLEKKTPLSITETSSVAWDCTEILTNVNTYGSTPQLTTLVKAEFALLEGQYSSAIKRDINSRGGKINGDTMKANHTSITFRLASADSATLQSLNIISLKYVDSPLTSN